MRWIAFLLLFFGSFGSFSFVASMLSALRRQPLPADFILIAGALFGGVSTWRFWPAAKKTYQDVWLGAFNSGLKQGDREAIGRAFRAMTLTESRSPGQRITDKSVRKLIEALGPDAIRLANIRHEWALLDELENRGLKRRDTCDAAMTRTLLPYRVVGDYSGHEIEIGFGAFLAWLPSRYSLSWCMDALEQHGDEALEIAGLFLLEHQAGGHICEHPSFLAKQVTLCDDRLHIIEELCRDYYYRDQGHFYRSNSHDIQAYRQRLSFADLTADTIFPPLGGHQLIEGIYPLDASDKNLSLLLANSDDALRELSVITEARGARELLALLIVAENSD